MEGMDNIYDLEEEEQQNKLKEYNIICLTETWKTFNDNSKPEYLDQ